MEYLIDGIRCQSSVYSISTGEKKDFKPHMCHDVLKFCISKMNVEQITALPKAPKDLSPNIIVQVKDGYMHSIIEPKTMKGI